MTEKRDLPGEDQLDEQMQAEQDHDGAGLGMTGQDNSFEPEEADPEARPD